MIIKDENPNFISELNDDVEKTADIEYGFANLGFIANILRKGIYANPHKSCVREIIDNAYDAHRQAGKQSCPISITVLNNQLIVEDFGIGISPDDMRKIYTVYGASTKRHTDELAGGFGLGCKSPFAITDQFTIVSRWNGKEYHYLAFIDEQNGSKLSQTMVSDTTECNGLKVSIPFKTDKRFEIVQYVKETCTYKSLWGDAVPKVHGLIDEIPTPKILFNHPDFISTPVHKAYNHVPVLVNGILYHVAVNFYGNLIDNINKTEVILKLNTGDVSFDVARENIKVDDTLNDKIKTKCESVINYILDYYDKNPPLHISKLSELREYADKVHQIINKPFKYKGNGISLTWPLTKDKHYNITRSYKETDIQPKTYGQYLPDLFMVYTKPLTSYQKAKIAAFARHESKQLWIVRQEWLDLNEIEGIPVVEYDKIPNYLTAAKKAKSGGTNLPRSTKKNPLLKINNKVYTVNDDISYVTRDEYYEYKNLINLDDIVVLSKSNFKKISLFPKAVNYIEQAKNIVKNIPQDEVDIFLSTYDYSINYFYGEYYAQKHKATEIVDAFKKAREIKDKYTPYYNLIRTERTRIKKVESPTKEILAKHGVPLTSNHEELIFENLKLKIELEQLKGVSP